MTFPQVNQDTDGKIWICIDGIEIRIMEAVYCEKGKPILVVNPDDLKTIKENGIIYK